MGELIHIVLSLIVLAGAAYNVRQWIHQAEHRGYTRG
jgi:predicted transporter